MSWQRDLSLGGWSEIFFGKPGGFFWGLWTFYWACEYSLRLWIFYKACGYFITFTDIFYACGYFSNLRKFYQGSWLFMLDSMYKDCLKVWKVKKERVNLNKYSYRLHIYEEVVKILQVNKYNTEYIEILNDSNFILTEHEKMKKCINPAETTNTGLRLQLSWNIHWFVMFSEKTVLFTSERVSEKLFMTKFCNHYPLLTLHIAGLRVDNSKIFLVKSWKLVRGKGTKIPILELRDIIEKLLTGKFIYLYFSSHQRQTCQLPPKTFVPQYNEISNVF